MVLTRNKQRDYKQKVQEKSHFTVKCHTSYCVRSGCLAMDKVGSKKHGAWFVRRISLWNAPKRSFKQQRCKTRPNDQNWRLKKSKSKSTGKYPFKVVKVKGLVGDWSIWLNACWGRWEHRSRVRAIFAGKSIFSFVLWN